MSHFHLKYFPQSGPSKVNFSAVFLSEIDALQAAGLANATRGIEPGYYGVQECRIRACETRRGAAAPRLNAPGSAPRTRVSPRSRMLN